jgi:hypothetical protein
VSRRTGRRKERQKETRTATVVGTSKLKQKRKMIIFVKSVSFDSLSNKTNNPGFCVNFKPNPGF